MTSSERKVQRRVRSLRRKIKKSKRRGWQKALLLLLFAVLVVAEVWIRLGGLSGAAPGGSETKGAGETVREEAGAKPPGDGQEPDTLPEGQLAVYFLDVGQADCILLETQDRYMLIDAGNRDDFGAIDAFLKEKGVERLDLVWFTHPHEDHIGSGAALLEAYEVGCVFLRTEAADTAVYADLEEVIQRKAIPRVVPEAGIEVRLGDSLIQVLGPLQVSDNPNNNSVILKVTFGKTRFLFTGDAEREEELDLLNNGCDVSADLLKVGHHGSETSTSYYFLREVWPAYAVISVGAGNDYGHPHEAVLSRLSDAEVTAYRTDECGTVTAVSDGNTVTFPGIE